MNDLDSRLTAALRADGPPAHDLLFRIEVLARLERRQFRRRVVQTLALAVAGVVLLALNARVINAWLAMDDWLVWIVALSAAAAMFVLPGVRVDSGPGARMLARALSRWLYPYGGTSDGSA